MHSQGGAVDLHQLHWCQQVAWGIAMDGHWQQQTRQMGQQRLLELHSVFAMFAAGAWLPSPGPPADADAGREGGVEECRSVAGHRNTQDADESYPRKREDKTGGGDGRVEGWVASASSHGVAGRQKRRGQSGGASKQQQSSAHPDKKRLRSALLCECCAAMAVSVGTNPHRVRAEQGFVSLSPPNP